MLDVLEDVTDEDSAKAAIPEMEDLGKRANEMAAQVKELPQPSAEEMQALQKKYAKRMEELQGSIMKQFGKLGQYPELGQATQKAMAGVK